MSPLIFDHNLRSIALAYDEAKRQESVLHEFRFEVPFALRLRIIEAERLLERIVFQTIHEDA